MLLSWSRDGVVCNAIVSDFDYACSSVAFNVNGYSAASFY